MKKKALLLFAMLSLIFTQNSYCQFSSFITAKDGKLYDGENELRFISFNIPNLHYIEDYLPFSETNPWKLPTEFEIRDALNAIKQMGGKVARIYVLSVKKTDDPAGVIRHVEAPGQFNEQAFAALDKVLQAANETGIRLIIPFVDNWWWWGGPKEYAAFRGKNANDFWTDSLLIADFKKTINFVLNRKNTYTGVLYKDDKAVLAWETGNELKCPYNWTTEIARYIKSMDANHLLIDGTAYGIVPDEAINNTYTDILTTHHYGSLRSSVKTIKANKENIKDKKPYFVGEFGMISTNETSTLLDTVIKNGLSGALVWSLRFRNEEGGFYRHHERDYYASFHWPGFKSGQDYDEINALRLIHKKAMEINNLVADTLPVPLEPELLKFDDVYKISWKGSTGAEKYLVARKTANDDWQIIDTVDDASIAYAPLYSDTSAETGKEYFYRIAAMNQSGISGWSNEAGPFIVSYKMIIDEMADFSQVYQKEGDLKILTYQDANKAKEDMNRLTGSDSSFIVYKTDKDINEIEVNAFAVNDKSGLEFFVSEDGKNYSQLNVEQKSYDLGKNEYGYYTPVKYTMASVQPGVRFVKIMLNNKVQISRTEIKYSKVN